MRSDLPRAAVAPMTSKRRSLTERLGSRPDFAEQMLDGVPKERTLLVMREASREPCPVYGIHHLGPRSPRIGGTRGSLFSAH